MAEREFAGLAKRGTYRDGRRVYVIFEFPTEYDAMQAFDVWSMDAINLYHKGPVVSKEEAES